MISGAQEKNKSKFNRKGITFIACIIIASCMWVVSSLSKEYVSSVSFPVKFKNLPKDRVISNHLPEELELEIQSNGFSLLGLKTGGGPDTLTVSASSLKNIRGNDSYLALVSRLDKINSQLGKAVKVLKVSPDTVYFNFNPKSNRVVPVKLNLHMNFSKEYQLSDEVKVIPAEVKISGSLPVIEKIKQLETEPLKLEGIDKEMTLKARLVLPSELRENDVAVTEVTVKIPVARYTEGSVSLPVQLINAPARKKVKIFPDKVDVKYIVTFSEYENIKPEMFKAVVDFSKSKNEKNNKMKIELVSHPKNVRQVKINPQKVEYILMK